MKKAPVALLLWSGLCANAASAFPFAPLARLDMPVLSIATASFQGTIPTEAHPIFGEKRLAKMRREGRLPDTFVRGRWEYNLAGDPGVAYYVKTCR